MEIFLTYLKVFAVGGVLCLLGQILINKTDITPARILVLFLLLGAVLEVTGAFKFIEEFAKAGITVPITGFGGTLARGAMKGAEEEGILGGVLGGLRAVSGGLTAAIFFGFLFALIFKAKTKPN
ncbi:MAG: SpoVA/SpoVAEb family sporulation membrane protein [Clostridiaceae bacterium]|jgi:stage V sporulation protein AE|nr:SpoVA/SpoVAEb family sporulation membrane protein [Clostridiaceae bacterium]